jgi:hypothetical protein
LRPRLPAAAARRFATSGPLCCRRIYIFANGNNAFVPEPERRNSGSPRCVEPAIHRNSFGQQRLSAK